LKQQQIFRFIFPQTNIIQDTHLCSYMHALLARLAK